MHKTYRTLVPQKLLERVETYARAMAGGDDVAGAQMAQENARPAQRDALARLAELGPRPQFEVIARARIGFQYIVKLRFCGGAERSSTLQIRWSQDESGEWRIAELNELGIYSPWKKPDKPLAVSSNG